MSRYSIQIELCGCLADPCGRHVTLDLGAPQLKVRDVFALLVAAHPALAAVMEGRRIRACVNDALVCDDSMVRIDDDVALFPPVSGG